MIKKLTTAQAARLLGVSDQTIANWIDHGQLPAGRTAGGHRRVEADDLVTFLKKQKLRVPAELAVTTPTILIVDDDQGVATWLSQAISSNRPNCRILIANDGYSAGEIVASERPSVVILDLYMPGMDGFEVCRKIKSRESTRNTTVLAITAHPSAEAQKAILDAGAATCLTKPLKIETIQKLLNNFLPDKK